MTYFVCQIDRDFKTGRYGEDTPRLYLNKTSYINITGVSYNDNLLIVKDEFDNHLKLKTEPNNQIFEETLYKDWKKFDEEIGKFDDDRTDYEPWALNSLESLAIELKLLDKNGVKMYYNKSYLS